MWNKDKVKTLEARIRIVADKLLEQSATYDKMNSKMFAMVGLLLTIGGLLTYDVFKIHTPRTALGWIVLVTALLLLAATVGLIAYDYRVRKNWYEPIGPVEEIKLDHASNYKNALQIIHQDYLEVYNRRKQVIERKATILNASLYMFVMSIILLLALKMGE